jgi:hypothetical protein
MIQCLYLGDDRWKMLTSGALEFKARNRSGREPEVNRTYTIHVMEKVTHADGRTRRQRVVLYLA